MNIYTTQKVEKETNVSFFTYKFHQDFLAVVRATFSHMSFSININILSDIHSKPSRIWKYCDMSFLYPSFQKTMCPPNYRVVYVKVLSRKYVNGWLHPDTPGTIQHHWVAGQNQWPVEWDGGGLPEVLQQAAVVPLWKLCWLWLRPKDWRKGEEEEGCLFPDHVTAVWGESDNLLYQQNAG